MSDQQDLPLGDMTRGAVFSVSEFLDFINELLGAHDFFVQGEVIGARPHPTGMYFSLKDADAGGVLDCYMSPYAYRGLGIAIEDGMHVKVGGIPSIYKPKGRFSFRVETLEPVGEGSLKKAYEALRKKLTEEGLFDRKRPLPEFVRTVGLVTSRTGAVIDDFRRNLSQRGLSVRHCDARVEGAVAVGQIISAIRTLDRGTEPLDVLVIIRGGGSMEDLQAFNDERVVRAVFGTRTPTIVSIGHDRDVPLAQMAADASASTPTATAHLINATWARLDGVASTAQRLTHAFDGLLASVRADVTAHAHRIGTHLARVSGAADRLSQRLVRGLADIGQRIAHVRELADRYERHLTAASPERQLGLGYAIVSDPSGAVIKNVRQLRHGQSVATRLASGSFRADVTELIPEP